MPTFNELLAHDPVYQAIPALDREAKAAHVGATPALLHARLKDARSVLLKVYRGTRPTFDFANQRLILHNGYALQWALRENTAAPESYANQQTSIGCCALVRVGMTPFTDAAAQAVVALSDWDRARPDDGTDRFTGNPLFPDPALQAAYWTWAGEYGRRTERARAALAVVGITLPPALCDAAYVRSASTEGKR